MFNFSDGNDIGMTAVFGTIIVLAVMGLVTYHGLSKIHPSIDDSLLGWTTAISTIVSGGIFLTWVLIGPAKYMRPEIEKVRQDFVRNPGDWVKIPETTTFINLKDSTTITYDDRNEIFIRIGRYQNKIKMPEAKLLYTEGVVLFSDLESRSENIDQSNYEKLFQGKRDEELK